jgi:hypothetical protein
LKSQDLLDGKPLVANPAVASFAALQTWTNMISPRFLPFIAPHNCVGAPNCCKVLLSALHNLLCTKCFIVFAQFKHHFAFFARHSLPNKHGNGVKRDRKAAPLIGCEDQKNARRLLIGCQDPKNTVYHSADKWSHKWGAPLAKPT